MLGIYVHIPFCKQKCLYCDFCSFPKTDLATQERYVDILCNDFIEKAKEATDFTVNTVFFGGGTPTCLPAPLLIRLFRAIKENYRLTNDAEVTLECNPATVDFSALLSLRKAGFNRLSLGLQSIHENELQALGRIHSYKDFLQTFDCAKSAGFTNISADLMFGIPEQTVKSYLETLKEVSSIGLQHLSCYSLILEEGTPLEAKKEDLPLPSEEEVRTMFLSGISFLKEQGFLQYEISNFAKKGYESQHNLRYWNQEPYLGFGVSAYSDFSGRRYGYRRNFAAFLAGNRQEIDVENLTLHERMNEYVMLRMRLCKGLSILSMEEKFGVGAAEPFVRRLDKYIPSGLVQKTDDFYSFTPEGMLVSNSILSDILDFEKE